MIDNNYWYCKINNIFYTLIIVFLILNSMKNAYALNFNNLDHFQKDFVKKHGIEHTFSKHNYICHKFKQPLFIISYPNAKINSFFITDQSSKTNFLEIKLHNKEIQIYREYVIKGIIPKIHYPLSIENKDIECTKFHISDFEIESNVFSIVNQIEISNDDRFKNSKFFIFNNSTTNRNRSLSK